MPDRERSFHLVLYGATGFTGRLVAEYLLKHYGVGRDLRWAMAGRNLEKLNRIGRELGHDDIPLITADSNDPAALDQMTSQTKVICTTVGPYARYGSELVASCMRNNTHYCDLAGEVPWIRKMIDKYHEAAQKSQIRIVHCCGFDSIPSEMGVFFLQQQAKEQHGHFCSHIKTGVKAAKGGMSGGTIASLTHVLEEAENEKELYKLLFDPYGLNPDHLRSGPDHRDLSSVAYDPHFSSWVCPFVMASINTRIVRRGHALLARPYGEHFRYDEFILTGKGVSGCLKAYATAIPTGLMMRAKPGTLTKKLMDWVSPKPGEGPSRDKRERGFWVFDFLGLLPDGGKMLARVKGDMDPGYGSTSKMLGEAAVCLAMDDLSDQYGVITPVVAMGQNLLTRLQENAGLTFRVKDI